MKPEQIQPEAVWKYFEDICRIPRPSFKEQKITSYLKTFGKDHHLVTIVDKAGNVLIKKPALKGYENRKSVCLQSHLDMVAEKESNSNHNFETDPIIPVIEGDWIKAHGTTLGADNGIGIAVQLAILADKTLKHGPIECLFTVEEEVGLKGAAKLKPGFITSEILINLDSEDEGELFIGCAGGIDTLAEIKFKSAIASKKHKAYKIILSRLKGGHSGDDINKGRGNSIKLLNKLLIYLLQKVKIRLSTFEGGNLRNAIPREAFAIITLKTEDEKFFKAEFNKYKKILKKEWENAEPGLKLTLEHIDLPDFIMKKKFQKRLLNVIQGCPHGVISMSPKMSNLVETSTNLASIKFKGINEITVSTSQRSSLETAKYVIADTIKSIFELANAKVTQGDGYPGWDPKPGSEILHITKQVYKKLFGNEPIVRAIHAGLECGMFLKIYPNLDMISFGPTIRDVHSPAERMEISSVKKFWDLLIGVLKEIPAK